MRNLSTFDRFVAQFEHALQTTLVPAVASRVSPAAGIDNAEQLSESSAQHASGLMRVNHVGEVCAQALYQGQAWVCREPAVKQMLLSSAQEELDHLAWTEQRLNALGSHTSYLNPLWYTGAFVLGAVAGKVSTAVSLGFVMETERQVGLHLQSHLSGDSPLPDTDAPSRAIVAQMLQEELAHAAHAQEVGGIELPNAVKMAMAGMAKIMTQTAYYI